MTVIIIEDEPIIADALEEKILRAHAGVRVAAKLESIGAALKYFEQHPLPDLFFSDIELRDGLSFEIFKKIKNTTPVIFCTAYDQYALEAFRVYGIDYLLKPFKQEDIETAIRKYHSIAKNPDTEPTDFREIIKALEAQRTDNTGSILIHRGEKIIPLEKEKIGLAETENGIAYVYAFSGERFAVNYSLDKLHRILGAKFYRVNRCFIINRKAIDHISLFFARKLVIKPSFKFDPPLIVSKAKANDFLKWLEAH